MKSILVPTDFSSPAENAMIYAAHLATATGSSLMIVHVYQIPVSMNDVPVMMISAEELRKNAEKSLGAARNNLLKEFPGLDIKTEARLGDVVDEIMDVCKDSDASALVAGKHGASGVERLLFGSTSLSLIRHSTLPVIVVPDNYSWKEIKNIAVAVDEPGNASPGNTIKNFCNRLSAKIHMIHVQQGKTELQEGNILMRDPDIHYATIRDDEFVHGIQTYVKENSIDVLIILPHKHSLVERLIFKTHTSEVLKKLSLPIMCITES